MQKFAVEKSLLEAIASYLASKPYAEVYTLIQALQQLAPIEETKEAE